MDIRAELEHINSVKKKLSIEIPAKQTEQEFRKASDEYKKYARIPGFRQGKAPLQLIKRRFAADIRDEVIRKLVPDAYDFAVKQEELSPLGQPSIENLKAEEGEALSFEAVLEILPKIELPDYKGLKITVEDTPVTDEAVTEQLEKLREQNAQLVAVEDRPVQDGDQVMVDLTGTFLDLEEGAKNDPVHEEGVIVQVGDEGTHAAFNKNLVGLNIGEEATFDADYPEDYPEKKLAGHKLQFTAEVTDIKKKVLPELNDEFAKDLGDFESLKDIEKRIREDLEANQERNRESQTNKALTDRLIELTSFELPEILVEESMNGRLENLARRIASQGVDPSRANINWKQVREEMRPDAETEVRTRLLLEEVAKVEDIKVTKEDLDAEIEELAQSMNQPVEMVRQYFSGQDRAVGMASDLRRRRALDIIKGSAKIKSKK
ncbi:MAG: trigger factor [Acidobacteriota bacterium]|nr:MAG: trigger factor [Acidobacteriota bacterium]